MTLKSNDAETAAFQSIALEMRRKNNLKVLELYLIHGQVKVDEMERYLIDSDSFPEEEMPTRASGDF